MSDDQQTQPAQEPDQWTEQLNDGTRVLIRPLQPDDRVREREFIHSLSSETRYNRFLGRFEEPSPELLDQLMDVNGRDRVALVALVEGPNGPLEIGVSRYAASGSEGDCECAVSVADAWQHRGLGRLLMQRLIDVARRNGYQRLFSLEAASNYAAHTFARSLGFEAHYDQDDPTLVRYSLTL